MKKRLAWMAVAVLMTQAAGTSTSSAVSFKSFAQVWDLDVDGKVTKDEFESMNTDIFTYHDENKNMVFDDWEYALYMDKSKYQDLIEGAYVLYENVNIFNSDTNKNKLLEAGEFLVGAQRWFKKLDRDGNGFLDMRDF